MKAAKELAETFARRDPESNEWERESLRARWTLGELEREDWVRLPPEKRVEARKRQAGLLEEMARASDRRLALSPDGGFWLSDRGNVRARLAAALLGLADAGDDPAANRQGRCRFPPLPSPITSACWPSSRGLTTRRRA